ncbi:hypothetical protein [Nocardia vulneris]|uniref:Immunity protein 35 domain-containing protein n=1 Tax=Nocardia vulneris TaxID=1141657 RepID=A0ABR4Z4K9_9NOCA|nr:hypothetical protein [Nocardia vulneris]KIA60237.1 hypothetical protein FG87_38085 [Nocardia vulneris]
MSDFFEALHATATADENSVNLVTVGAEQYGTIYFVDATYSYDEKEEKYVIYGDNTIVEFNKDKVIFICSRRFSPEEVQQIITDSDEGEEQAFT